ncbi:MAG: IclR family transcriptional regulator [Pararhodobacter sp.]
MAETTSDRVLSVLTLFAGDQPEWTVEEAAEALGLPVSTAYRYFRSLAKSGLLIPHVPGRYLLGPAIIQLDRQLQQHDPFITAARPEMLRLAGDIGDTVILLARLYRNTVMCVHQESAGSLSIGEGYERGRPMPLDRGAASKAILANLPPRTARALALPDENGAVPLTMNDALRAELRQIRMQGFSITHAEIERGIRGFSVPVFRPGQVLEGSLSVVLPDTRPDTRSVIDALIQSRKVVEANLAVRATAQLTDLQA